MPSTEKNKVASHSKIEEGTLRRNRVASYFEIDKRAKKRKKVAEHSEKGEEIEDVNKNIFEISFLN